MPGRIGSASEGGVCLASAKFELLIVLGWLFCRIDKNRNYSKKVLTKYIYMLYIIQGRQT